MDSYSLKKRKRTQKDMGKKFVSKTDVMSLSGVMYSYVSKISNITHKTISN